MALSRVKVWGNEILTATDLNAEFNNIINNASSLISPLSGSLDWDGYAHTLDAAGVTTAQSTSSIGWAFTPGSKSGTPSTTGGISNWATSTWTDSATAGSGTATAWVGHAFKRSTLAASNASVTTTDAATVYIDNAPAAGSNEILTNPWALWIDAGNVRIDDNLVWLSGTSFKGTLDHANSADRTYTFPDATTTLVGTDTSQTLTNKILANTRGTTTATTSGTTHDYTGIPSWVTRITLSLSGVSTNGTSHYIVQIGDSGGVETSGYVSTTTYLINDTGANGNAETTGFKLTDGTTAAETFHGAITLTLLDAATNLWAATNLLSASSTSRTCHGSGSKALSATLDRVRLTTVSGADTFDAGSINIMYE